MSSAPLSLKKTRQAVRQASDDLTEQGRILNQHAELLNTHSEAITSLADVLIKRSLWGRLRWLLKGV